VTKWLNSDVYVLLRNNPNFKKWEINRFEMATLRSTERAIITTHNGFVKSGLF
jgi:hypothetical protein